MWLDRIIEAKEALHISSKTISAKTGGHLPERTISRILSRETETPRIDTIIELGAAVGLSPQEIFADTNVLVATETFEEVKENAEEIKDELSTLREKTREQEAEIAILQEQLKHKDAIIDLHERYLRLLEAK